MKKSTLLLHSLTAAFLSITSLVSMNCNTHIVGAHSKAFLSIATESLDTLSQDQINDTIQASENYAFNENQPLVCVMSTFFSDIDVLTQPSLLLYCKPEKPKKMIVNDNGKKIKKQIKSLLPQNTIEVALRLSITCKHLRELLTAKKIPQICSYYDPIMQNAILRDIIKSMHVRNYKTKRLPALIAIDAGAKNSRVKTNYCEDVWLENAVLNHDMYMVQKLLENGANPNAKSNLGQLFCYAGTVKVAEIFFKHGAEIDAAISSQVPEYGPYYPNVLWEVVHNKYPAELMEFYLARDVNPRTRFNPSNKEFTDGNCLFHELANPACLRIDDIDNFLRKAHLLLDVIPDMINTVNHDEQTPADVAQRSFEAASRYMCNGTAEAFEDLIMLFKAYDGKTTDKCGSSIKKKGLFLKRAQSF